MSIERSVAITKSGPRYQRRCNGPIVPDAAVSWVDRQWQQNVMGQ